MPRPQPLDWLVLAALVVAWGSAFGALKIAVHDISPVWNTVIRLWVASATLVVVCLASRAALPPLWPRPHPAWGYYLFIGTVGLALPFFLFAYAAAGIPSAVNAICNGASPVFTAALAVAVLRDEPLGPRRLAGVIVGFLGLIVLVAPRLAEGMGVEALALICALAGAACYAIANVVTRKAPQVPSSAGALMMCLTGAIGASLAAALFEPPMTAWPSLPAMAAVVALGVFTTALAGIGYVFLVQRQGPVFMSMAIYLAPLWAMALGLLLMGERPGWPAYAALGLILAGVALATTTRKA